jgi:pimeloyl-ACP methyl ester carboxylesterase
MTIVYLHGFASGPSSGKARYFVRQFAEAGVSVDVPDLAAGDFEHLTITGQLRVIDEVARGQAVSLIGSSMGGYLAALYASLHREVHKVVLLAPAFRFPERWPLDLGPEKTAQWQQTGWMEVYHYGDDAPRRLHYGLIEDALQYPLEPHFTQPGLIFHGSADDVVPASYSEAFCAGRENVKLRLLESDHQLTDVVDVIWQDVREFLLG